MQYSSKNKYSARLATSKVSGTFILLVLADDRPDISSLFCDLRVIEQSDEALLPGDASIFHWRSPVCISFYQRAAGTFTNHSAIKQLNASAIDYKVEYFLLGRGKTKNLL